MLPHLQIAHLSLKGRPLKIPRVNIDSISFPKAKYKDEDEDEDEDEDQDEDQDQDQDIKKLSS